MTTQNKQKQAGPQPFPRLSRKSVRSRWATLAVASVGALVLVGCAGGGSSTEPSESTSTPDEASAAQPRIAMVTPASTDEFYLTMYCGARAAAAGQDIELTISGTTEITTEAVMQVVQTVLATEPEGMVLVVWDQEAFNTTMEPYFDSGRPLVMPDSFISSGDFTQSIRTDSYQSSYDAALAVVSSFELSAGKVIIVTDSPGNGIQSARAEGFKDGLEAETDLEVLEIQYIGNDAADASNAVVSAAAGNDDLVMVFSTNIGAGTGAANGIATSEKQIVHVGYDTSSSQVAQLRAGDYDVLVAQSPFQMGFDSVTLVAELLKGVKTTADITEQTIFSDSALVTQANVDSPEIARFLYKEDCS